MPRLVGEKLTAIWGQAVVIDNRPGAAGNLGMEAGAKAPADGYTLLSAPNGNMVVNPHMYSKLAYDVFRDLAPITRIAAVQNVLVVHPDVPAKTVMELVALAKAKPGELTFASPGNGSQAHVAVELLKLRLGLDLVHVPYQGVGPAMKDVLGGRITLMVAQVPSALPHIKAGKLRERGAPPRAPRCADGRFGGGVAGVRSGVLVRPDGAGRRAARDRCEDPGRRGYSAADAGRARAPRRHGCGSLGRIERGTRRARQDRIRQLGRGRAQGQYQGGLKRDARQRAHVLGNAGLGRGLAHGHRLGDARCRRAGGIRRTRAAEAPVRPLGAE